MSTWSVCVIDCGISTLSHCNKNISLQLSVISKMIISSLLVKLHDLFQKNINNKQYLTCDPKGGNLESDQMTQYNDTIQMDYLFVIIDIRSVSALIQQDTISCKYGEKSESDQMVEGEVTLPYIDTIQMDYLFVIIYIYRSLVSALLQTPHAESVRRLNVASKSGYSSVKHFPSF